MNLTKKVWNTLSYKTRVEIITIIKQTPVWPSYYYEFIHYNYAHDFDYNQAGKALKTILSHCRLQEDGTIDVVLTVNPTYGGINQSIEQEQKEKARKQKNSKVTTSVNNTPVKWYIDYEYPDGDEMDLAHEWFTAYDAQDAENQFWDDHSNKCKILSIRKA